MIKPRLFPRADESARDQYMTFTPSYEARICLECTLPDCKKTKCERFRAEKRKLKQKEG